MKSDTQQPVYVHGLRAENFLRLELVELAFQGPGLELITGMNGEGKSSLLRAIFAALAGKGALPEKPVRKGKEKAEVVVDLGDRIVKLKVKPDRSATLSVESKDGARYSSPQRMLDEIVGALAFDPLEFAEMEPKAQADQLRQLAGLDFSKLDAEAKEAFDERTLVNREVKRLEAQLSEMPPVLEAVANPGEEVAVGELVKQQQAAIDQQRAHDLAARRAEEVERQRDQHVDRIKKLEEEIAQESLHLERTRTDLVAAREKLGATPAPTNMDQLAEQLRTAEHHNRAVRARRADAERLEQARAVRKGKMEEFRTRASAAEDLTRRLEAIAEEKRQAIAAAKFPVPGLSVDETGVTLDGMPLAQASSAQQIRACLAIAAALNPRLRLLLVRQGNDLDAVRLREVAEWARENQYQIIVERVAGDRPTGIVIEAGKVAADLRSAPTAAPAPAPAPAGAQIIDLGRVTAKDASPTENGNGSGKQDPAEYDPNF